MIYEDIFCLQFIAIDLLSFKLSALLSHITVWITCWNIQGYWFCFRRTRLIAMGAEWNTERQMISSRKMSLKRMRLRDGKAFRVERKSEFRWKKNLSIFYMKCSQSADTTKVSQWILLTVSSDLSIVFCIESIWWFVFCLICCCLIGIFLMLIFGIIHQDKCTNLSYHPLNSCITHF